MKKYRGGYTIYRPVIGHLCDENYGKLEEEEVGGCLVTTSCLGLNC